MPRQFTFISEFTAIDDRKFLAMRKVRTDGSDKRARGGVWVPLDVTDTHSIEDVFGELVETRASAAKLIELIDTLIPQAPALPEPEPVRKPARKPKKPVATEVEATAATPTPSPEMGQIVIGNTALTFEVPTVEQIRAEEAAKAVDDPTRLSGTEIKRKAAAARLAALETLSS